ncbi:MAG TPA: FlgD immunoglobulin-like domain containing protein [Candidatus Udaeobacter sp.]|nr:FlgD immunoglobulin-like domain containing protein [Candidatus Udaeobacter sp.]
MRTRGRAGRSQRERVRRGPRRSFSRSRDQKQFRRFLAFLIGLAVLFLAPVLAHAQAQPDSVNLAWTAPGDDANIGTATTYDIRMSTSPIDVSSWNSATPVPGAPTPRTAGTRQSMTVKSLTYGTTYYFAIRTQDDAGNWSGLSNVLRWDWIADTAPPAAPSGVSATKGTNDVHVHWAANSEADLDGYTVYRATSASGPWSALNGTLLTSTDYYDANLPSANQVWYAVTASDWSQNQSARSASASVSLVTTTAASADWSVETGYPNPSNLSSPVTFAVVIPGAGGSGGTLVITDDVGHRLRTLSLSSLSSGRQLVSWDGKNESGRTVAPGVYRAIVMAGGQRSTSRLVRVP